MKSEGILKTEKIKDFLNNFSHRNTKASYRSCLINFFEFNGKNPDEYIKDVRRMDNGDKLDVLDQYEKDLADFQQHLISQGRQPKTVTASLVVLRVFFRRNRIQLDEMVWDNLRHDGIGNAVMTDDEAPTKQQLKNILSHTDAKGRALILTLTSSGIRINEALQIKLKDIENQIKENISPIRIRIIPTVSKNKKVHTTYISDEAKEAIAEWLKVRDNYLKRSSAKTRIHKIVDGKKIEMRKSPVNDNLFPFTYDTALQIWNNLIIKAGCNSKDDNTGRYKIHIHALRKYFKTNFSKYDYHMSEVFLGHTGYLGGVYDKMTEEEKRLEYLKGVEHLLVFSTLPDFSEVNAEIGKLKQELQEKTIEMAGMYQMMKRTLDELNEQKKKR